MEQRRKTQTIAFLFIAFIAMLALFYSGNRDLQISGFSGAFDSSGFIVDQVNKSSPAYMAGLKSGDRITILDSMPIQTWHRLFENELSTYLTQRSTWHNRLVPITVERNGNSHQLNMAVRAPGLQEWAELCGARMILILVLIGLSAFILISNPKDNTAFLFALSFTASGVWFAADMPVWPKFMSPVMPEFSMLEFATHDFLVTIFMQIAVSSFLHILLIFPRPLTSREFRKYLIIGIYIIPVSFMLLAITYYASSNLIDRMTEIYRIRLWLDTFLLSLATALILLSYGLKKTRIQIEQSRLIMASVLIFTSTHLGLWNIPKLVTGLPLVPSYNWILLALVIIPISLTLAIANHQIFGVRGLVLRRLQRLSSFVEKERLARKRRDNRIKSLLEEIDQLHVELKAYEVTETKTIAEGTKSDRLRNLEHEFPLIAEARKTELLGVSLLWDQVFSDAALASMGKVPILIVGESGTGKTAMARLISGLAGFDSDRYREISCAQFEHADPAFALGRIFGVGTDHGLQNLPKAGSKGLLEECDGGALFLDDFDRLPLNVQDLLLYPLEHKPFEPGIGTGQQKTVDVKFIIATNRDPAELIELGKFQRDVLARFGARVYIPPLRDRREDLPLLIERILEDVSSEIDHAIESVSSQAIMQFSQYHYSTGNVRELKAELRIAVGNARLESDSILRSSYLSPAVKDGVKQSAPIKNNPSVQATQIFQGVSIEMQVLRKNGFAIKQSEEELGLSHKSKTLSHHLRGMCIQALVDSNWDVEKAAKSLVGNDDLKTISKLRSKIEHYAKTINERKSIGEGERLFVNLPSTYHMALRSALENQS